MVGEVVVGNGDISRTHNHINKAIRTSGEEAVVDPDVVGAKYRHCGTSVRSSLPVMRGRASDHRRSGTFAVVDVHAMNDDAMHILHSQASTAGDMDVVASTIDGLVTVDHEFLFERDHHVAGEDDPERLLLQNAVT